MILKDDLFTNSILFDIKELKFGNTELKLKGSFLSKKDGEYISDLDFSANVKYSENLFKKIVRVIQSSDKFIFIRMVCGVLPDCIPPWGIEFENFLFEEAVVWSQKMANRLNAENKQLILNILSKSALSALDFLKIEKIVKEETELIWSLQNIYDGYIIKNDIKYDIMTIIKQEIPVLELAYKYNNDMCPIDIGLQDKNYKYVIPRKKVFLSQNWYNIAKTVKRRITSEYKDTYYTILSGINELIALKYYNQMIKNLAVYRKIESEYSDLTLNDIETQINQYILDNISFFDIAINHMLPEFTEEFLINITMAYETMIPVTKINTEKGINVFFKSDIEDIYNMIKVSKILNKSVSDIIILSKKVSIEQKIPIKLVINSYF